MIMDTGAEMCQLVLGRRGEMESDVMITIGDPEETTKTILQIGRNININKQFSNQWLNIYMLDHEKIFSFVKI
jgi:hypothetical protein